MGAAVGCDMEQGVRPRSGVPSRAIQVRPARHHRLKHTGLGAGRRFCVLFGLPRVGRSFSHLYRQRHGKRRAVTFSPALNRDMAVVQFHDAADDGKT